MIARRRRVDWVTNSYSRMRPESFCLGLQSKSKPYITQYLHREKHFCGITERSRWGSEAPARKEEKKWTRAAWNHHKPCARWPDEQPKERKKRLKRPVTPQKRQGKLNQAALGLRSSEIQARRSALYLALYFWMTPAMVAGSTLR